MGLIDAGIVVIASRIDWNLVIVAVAPTIAALAALWQAVKTHNAVNSRMDELLKLAKAESAAAATLAEKDAEHVRKGEAAIAKATSARTRDGDTTATR